MKILFTLLILSLSAFSAEDEKSIITRKVKERREELKLFREKVSLGDRCQVRDYKCFKNEVRLLTKGQPEDLMFARSVLEPFYLRSIKDGVLPCGGSCQQNMLAHHIDTFISFLLPYFTPGLNDRRISAYPTIDGIRIRSVMELSGIGAEMKNTAYLNELLTKLKPQDITDKDVKDVKKFNEPMTWMSSGEHFSESILCRLQPGDMVYDEMVSDKKLAPFMKEFTEKKKVHCKNTSPMDYRGLDESTRKHYAIIRDAKLKSMGAECGAGDFGCIRRHLRTLGILYSDDVMKVNENIKAFVVKSKKSECDETCQAQSLISVIQTWVTFFSNFDRAKLASTMNPRIHPQAKFEAIPEDIAFYSHMREILDPLIAEFGKIDSRNVKDPGLKSELKSVGKDLSDFASGRLFKDSMICKMDPWIAAYDKYLSPTKDRKTNQKFEEAFLEFKSNVCK